MSGRTWSVYDQAEPLVWEDGGTYRMACCDCGSVHEFHVKVNGPVATIRVGRDNRATAQFRRYREYPYWKKGHRSPR